MPKIIDFPRASLQRSLEAARAVDELGGECTKEMCASNLGRKVGGAFEAVLGAAAKFGLIERHKDKLAVTEQYREYKLAYDDGQKIAALRSAFLEVPVFRRVCARFEGKKLPTEILDKLLIKEFAVPEAQASRVASYLVDGAKEVQLIDEGGIIQPTSSNSIADATDHEDPTDSDPSAAGLTSRSLTDPPRVAPRTNEPIPSAYSVSIRGPGMDTEIAILDPEDLTVVEALLRKVRRSLQIPSDEQDEHS